MSSGRGMVWNGPGGSNVGGRGKRIERGNKGRKKLKLKLIRRIMKETAQ